MKQFVALVLAGSVVAGPVYAADPAEQLKDVDFCYGVSALSASTVQLRNQGQTQEEQLARRKESLGEGEFALIADITKQVYDKDLRDPFVVAGDTNAACLQARGHGRAFVLAGQRQCPRVGMMKAEVDAMRRSGASAEDTVKALKERYGKTRTALGESLEQTASAEPKGDTPDSGVFENQMCMILAITGK